MQTFLSLIKLFWWYMQIECWEKNTSTLFKVMARSGQTQSMFNLYQLLIWVEPGQDLLFQKHTDHRCTSQLSLTLLLCSGSNWSILNSWKYFFFMFMIKLSLGQIDPRTFLLYLKNEHNRRVKVDKVGKHVLLSTKKGCWTKSWKHQEEYNIYSDEWR